MVSTRRVLIKLIFIFFVSSQNIVLGGLQDACPDCLLPPPLVYRLGTSGLESCSCRRCHVRWSLLFDGSGTAKPRGLEFYIRGSRLSEHLCGGTTIILIRDVSEQILSINLSIKKGFSH